MEGGQDMRVGARCGIIDKSEGGRAIKKGIWWEVVRLTRVEGVI